MRATSSAASLCLSPLPKAPAEKQPGSSSSAGCFSAGCFWRLLADASPAGATRAALAALGIEFRLVAPNAMALAGTDIGAMLAYVARQPWLSFHFTRHDWGHIYRNHAEVRATLQAALEGASLTLSSAQYLSADAALLGDARIVYVGTDEEVAEVSGIVQAGGALDATRFALHGSTQRAAHDLLHSCGAPFVAPAEA